MQFVNLSYTMNVKPDFVCLRTPQTILIVNFKGSVQPNYKKNMFSINLSSMSSR